MNGLGLAGFVLRGRPRCGVLSIEYALGFVPRFKELRVVRLIHPVFAPAMVFLVTWSSTACSQDVRAKLSEAIFNNDVKQVVMLAKKLDINQKAKNWDPPLHEAVASGHIEVVKALVEMGAVVEARESMSNMPLLNSAAALGDEKVFDYLVAKGAKIDQIDKYGGNALEEAAFGGHTKIAAKLMKLGLKSKHKLHVAAGLGDVKTVKKLLAAKVDVDMLTGWKNSALIFAAGSGQEKTLHLLLAAKAKMEVRNVMGCTAMHYAAAMQNVGVVEALLKAGANVNAPNAEKETPLDWSYDPKVQKLLRKAGARHSSGFTQ